MNATEQKIQSDQINEIAGALAKAQGEISTATFDSQNPHFKSNYASYESFRKACQEPLSKNGLSITHQLLIMDGKRVMVTQLSHASGQWFRSYLSLPQDKETPQGVGSSITYAKRYTLGAILSMGSDVDDDANQAERECQPSRPAEPKYLSPEQIKAIRDTAPVQLLDRIFEFNKVTSLEQVPADQFGKIIAAARREGGAQ